MVQGGDGAGLALEEGEALRVAGHLLGEHLDRDVAPEAGIPRAVDLAHAAGPKKLDDLVGSESRAGRQRHRQLSQGQSL